MRVCQWQVKGEEGGKPSAEAMVSLPVYLNESRTTLIGKVDVRASTNKQVRRRPGLVVYLLYVCICTHVYVLCAFIQTRMSVCALHTIPMLYTHTRIVLLETHRPLAVCVWMVMTWRQVASQVWSQRGVALVCWTSSQ